MTESPRELLDVLELKDLGDDRFLGEQIDRTRMRVFGGQVVAQALIAACRTAPELMNAHSLHAYFLRPGDSAVDIEYEVERVRDGRSFATRRVVAIQHGRPIYTMMTNFHVDEPGFEHQDPMPLAPPPEESRPYAHPLVGEDDTAETAADGDDNLASKAWRSDAGVIDMRYAGNTRIGDILGEHTGVAEARSWLKYAGPMPDDPHIHQAVLAYMSDLTLFGSAALPHAEPGLEDFTDMASLDHAIWFHRPVRVDQWLLFAHRSPSAASARGLVHAAFYTEDGVLAASVAQEGLMRPAPHFLTK